MSIFIRIKSFFRPDPEVHFQAALREDICSGNYEKAAWLYQKAIDCGHIKAKYFLAVMYFMGRGVTQDRNKAITLVRESAATGYDEATKLLADIERGAFRS